MIIDKIQLPSDFSTLIISCGLNGVTILYFLYNRGETKSLDRGLRVIFLTVIRSPTTKVLICQSKKKRNMKTQYYITFPMTLTLSFMKIWATKWDASIPSSPMSLRKIVEKFLKPKNVSGAVTVKRDTGPFSKWKIDGASE